MKRKRPVDWVANQESWDRTSPPYLFNPAAAGVVSQYSAGEINLCTLTFHQDIVDGSQQFGTPQLEQTAVRVVGSLIYGLHSFNVDDIPTVNLTLGFNFRVVVGQQQIDTFYASDLGAALPNYDMNTPMTANDDFLWHYNDETVLSNSWWSFAVTQASDWRIPRRIPIDIRVQRRLKQREILLLVMQMYSGPVVTAAGVLTRTDWADLRGWVQPQLRTLVRTIT